MHHFPGSKDAMAVSANKAGEIGERDVERQVPWL